MTVNLDRGRISHLRTHIPEWYEENGRAFDWRDTDDPYEILVAEILLQKTTADQVVKVYKDFFKNFSSPEEVVKSDLGKLKDTISELGLVKRARYLKDLSRDLVEKHAGKVPNDKRELEWLLGVGQYTRNAVLCFAFNEAVPIVDSNVARVLRRYFRLNNSKPPYRDKKLWQIASKIMPPDRAQEYNLGLLDLADEICLYDSPSCDICPLASKCEVDWK